ncbi:hypothetical protein K1719_009294 [Acacia pycnantha]|nr:hypothetical protein K1719_009294 [Acacia pycnantha]
MPKTINREWNANNVFVWYDSMERILKQTQRRFDEGTTYKFACEFFFGDEFSIRKVESVRRIKGCGIWPICASELQETVQQMELKLENRTET